MRLFLLLMLAAAANAFAVPMGGKLYVKSKDTKVRKSADAKAATLLTLQPGTEVTWQGADAKNPEWHQVQANGKTGFVQRGDLTPNRPAQEVDAAGRPASPVPFAQSGYIKCSFGPSTQPYQGDSKQAETRAELIYVEELNRQKATPAAVDEKVKELQR